ncbi:hypothetical protein FNH22_24080 [Fulvivirga sp. M361]|uniref:hypothetical protein n=1 Tax=Fulvivirga sp. M361 TaxID=2594266 RepID=UPI00117ADF78|nr:hypothetical protein [Fulvivirga sp. M361]TRX51643.1 hypothetical protein FNH22_24080 [Fulvivirga sp. M361]
MKLLTVLSFFLVLSISLKAQNWSGSTPGNIYYNSGNVGIGTANPNARLNISATGDGAELLRLSTERAWAFVQRDVGVSAALELKDLTGGKYFRIRGFSDELAFSIKSNTGDGYIAGKLGIGTTTPLSPLHINANHKGAIFENSVNGRTIEIDPGNGSIDMTNGYLHLNRFSNENVIIGLGGGRLGVGYRCTGFETYRQWGYPCQRGESGSQRSWS